MKNKILSILCIFILISFIFINNNAFAYSSTDVAKDVDDVTLNNCLSRSEYNSETMNYVICQNSDGVYFVFWSKSTGIEPYVEFYNNSFYLCLGSVSKDITLDFYVIRNNTYVDYKENTTLYINNITTNFSSNLNIINTATGSYFFRPTPVTLAETLELNNPIQVWKELMKSVVVSLVVFLVGLVAFLKAWAWLKTQLHKA